VEGETPQPDVSIAVLADYAAGEAHTYELLRATLRGLAGQTCRGSSELLLIESRGLQDRLPLELIPAALPVRVVFADADTSFALRNVAVCEARADLIAFLDADCVPDPDWLERLLGAVRSRPDIVAASGRTTYGGTGLIERSLSLLSRAYVERGDAGPVRQVSNNNAVYRTAALRHHPFPASTNPFVAALHAGRLMETGQLLWFEPAAHVRHAYGGWVSECDVARNAGWATIAIRQVESHARLSGLVRFGHLAVPVLTLITLLRSWSRLLRFHAFYGLRWFEVPIAFGVALFMSLMQVPGMHAALRGRPIRDTPYR
jgi:hypothetical protein